MKTLHETDFAKWLEEQTSLLKQKRFNELDIEHLIEEMEDLGGSEKSAIESHLTIIMMHMIKQQMQPERASKSWDDSIVNGRVQINKILKRNPSMRNYLHSVYHECFKDAVKYASKEMGKDLKAILPGCSWNLKDILGE